MSTIVGTNDSLSELPTIVIDPSILEEYTGERLNGKKHGRGSQLNDDGSQYEGNWANDVYHGRGTLIYPDGDKYEGNWEHG